jgi:hypothetical protein
MHLDALLEPLFCYLARRFAVGIRPVFLCLRGVGIWSYSEEDSGEDILSATINAKEELKE